MKSNVANRQRRKPIHSLFCKQRLKGLLQFLTEVNLQKVTIKVQVSINNECVEWVLKFQSELHCVLTAGTMHVRLQPGLFPNFLSSHLFTICAFYENHVSQVGIGAVRNNFLRQCKRNLFECSTEHKGAADANKPASEQKMHEG